MLMLDQVVEDVSSCLGNSELEITQHIASDHRDMCRFSGLHDQEYAKVAAALEYIKTRLPTDHTQATVAGWLAVLPDWGGHTETY